MGQKHAHKSDGTHGHQENASRLPAHHWNTLLPPHVTTQEELLSSFRCEREDDGSPETDTAIARAVLVSESG